MRVLGIVSSASRRGAEVVGSQLIDHLTSSGHPSKLVALAPARGPAIRADSVGRSRLDPRVLLRLMREGRRSDVIVGFGGSSLLAGAVVAMLVRRPFVYRSIGDPAAWGDVRARAVRLGWPARRAERLVALYPDAARTWSALHGVDAARIRIIPNAAPVVDDASATPAARQAARERLGLTADGRRWLAFVGALSEEKAPMDAVEVVRRDPTLGLLVAGDGPLRSAVEAAASSAPEQIRVLGAIEDVAPVYEAADLVLLTSRTEGMPGVLIEAGMYGVPVVAADVGGVGAVVVDGSTGILYPAGDLDRAGSAVAQALERRVPLGRAAVQHCRDRFSIDTVFDEWVRLLAEVARS